MAGIFNRFNFSVNSLRVVSKYVSPGTGRVYLRLESPDGVVNCTLDNSCPRVPDEGNFLKLARLSVINTYNKETGARSCWVALLDYES